MLYIIGIGLGDEKDITLNALDVIKKCKFVYLESYTSDIGFDKGKLEVLAGNQVELVDRGFVESGEILISNSSKEDVALLIKGDVFSATTHVDLVLRAKEKNIKVKVLHNSSILTVVGDCGLSLYKFGKVASIPFDNENINTPYEILKANGKMHSLFLLDLNPKENKYMNFREGLNYLVSKGVDKERKAVVCCGLGTDSSVIKYGLIKNLLELDIQVYPQCIILPGELHFIEEDMLKQFTLHQQ